MNWLPHFVTENVGLKLLSLAMAVAVWGTLGSDPSTEAIFRVPLELSNAPAHREVLPEPTSVEIRVRGPSRAVRRATPGDFSIRLDLSGIAHSGEQTVLLHPHAAEVPMSLTVLEIVPAQVKLTVDRERTNPDTSPSTADRPR